MTSPPKTNNATTTRSVSDEVITVRDSVWFTDAFMISTGVPLRIRRKFSRMRSNTTIVSFSEYPIRARMEASTVRSN